MSRAQTHARLSSESSDASPAQLGADDVRTLVERILGDVYTVRPAGVADEILSHLDTVDQRLRKAGLDLVFDVHDNVLRAYPQQTATVDQPTGPMDWPALVSAIPHGAVRDLVSGPAWIRALVPFATSEAHRFTFDVLNDDGKTIARIQWRQGSLTTPQQQRLPLDVSIDRLRGYQADARTVRGLLEASVPISDDGRGWLAAVHAQTEPESTPGRRFGMHPDQAGDLAVADALLGYLDRLEANVDGVIADTDTEFLHQLRVETRRTRSVLKLLGDVLPAGMADAAVEDFRWLGDVTTPTRDLDVYLLEMDELAAQVQRGSDLEPLAEHIRKRRTATQVELATALESTRFTDLLARWRSDLTAVVSSRSTATTRTSELAGDRIERAFRRVQKRAAGITDASPGEAIHALRKACKEMRYLLELFRPVCDPKVYKSVVAEFKELQEVLGEFQDGEVQAAALHGFARQMLDDGDVHADTLLAMGALSAYFEARQRDARATLTSRPGGYVDRRLSKHVQRLVTR